MCVVSEKSTTAYGSLQNYVLNQITMLHLSSTSDRCYDVQCVQVHKLWVIRTNIYGSFQLQIIKHVVPHPHLTQLSIWPKEDKLLIYNLPLKDLTPELCFPIFPSPGIICEIWCFFSKKDSKNFSSCSPPPNQLWWDFKR